MILVRGKTRLHIIQALTVISVKALDAIRVICSAMTVSDSSVRALEISSIVRLASFRRPPKLSLAELRLAAETSLDSNVGAFESRAEGGTGEREGVLDIDVV